MSARALTTIVWFRQDLRLADNPALDAAVKRGEPILPLYIWSPEDDGDWPPGAASRWWLHQSLTALDEALRERGSRLILATGPRNRRTREARPANRRNRRLLESPLRARRDRVLRPPSRKPSPRRGIETASFNSALLAEPSDILNLSGKPYRVYTPYMRRVVRDLESAAPLRAPSKLKRPSKWPKSASLASLDLDADGSSGTPGSPTRWQPGEDGAHARLKRFLTHKLAKYKQERDHPAIDATSGLSPHLHFGEIGPRQIWHALGARGRASTFLHELIWREFAYHLLYHFPETTDEAAAPGVRALPVEEERQSI